MALVLVVADDLTGANATAAGFARGGFRAATTSTADGTAALAAMANSYDVVVASTDSRHAPPERAQELMRAAIRAVWPVRLVVNRVDTTLRGNIGATTAAALEEVAALAGRRSAALCAPAHPEAGRHTVQGVQYLQGQRLEDTEVARDARTPVHTSVVAGVVAEQAPALACATVPLSAVTGPPEDLRDQIADALRGGADVLITDALTVGHLRLAAEGAVAAGTAQGTEGPYWVGVDPGPGAVELARALGLRGAGGRPLLLVSGSATELTRTQLAELAAQGGRVSIVRTPVVAGTAVPDVAATVEVAGRALAQAGPGDVVALATVVDDSDLRRVGPDEAAAIPTELARAAAALLADHPVDGLMTTGGDVTAAVVAALGADGLEITDEIVPLAVGGSLVGGPFRGLPLVTKGGLVGSRRTIVDCLEHLRRAATSRRHHPTTS